MKSFLETWLLFQSSPHCSESLFSFDRGGGKVRESAGWECRSFYTPLTLKESDVFGVMMTPSMGRFDIHEWLNFHITIREKYSLVEWLKRNWLDFYYIFFTEPHDNVFDFFNATSDITSIYDPCVQFSPISELVLKMSPYLYPFSIEYSILIGKIYLPQL